MEAFLLLSPILNSVLYSFLGRKFRNEFVFAFQERLNFILSTFDQVPPEPLFSTNRKFSNARDWRWKATRQSRPNRVIIILPEVGRIEKVEQTSEVTLCTRQSMLQVEMRAKDLSNTRQRKMRTASFGTLILTENTAILHWFICATVFLPKKLYLMQLTVCKRVNYSHVQDFLITTGDLVGIGEIVGSYNNFQHNVTLSMCDC